MSEIKYITIKQNDGYQIKLTHHCCAKNPKASILILHGMAEHQKRYYNFSEFLVNQGIDVYLYDHRGHGTDTIISELGFISPMDGYQLLIHDAITVCKYIEQNNRSNKFFVLGHSMGSLIARTIMTASIKTNGFILVGTTHPSKLITNLGLFLSTIMIKIKGPKKVSPYMNHMIFGSKKFTSLTSRTKFDWLTRNNPVVGSYIHDPYCGFTCTISFYHDLLKLVNLATKKKPLVHIKKELPIYILSGEKDPVGNYGKEPNKLYQIYKKVGFSTVQIKLYPDCRHEILNELNKDEVYTDLYQWINKRT